jgi:hypothetical protein
MKLMGDSARGDFIEGLGFAYYEHRMIVNINSHDALAVFMNGEELSMREGESSQRHVLQAKGHGTVSLLWSIENGKSGHTVEIVTGA